MIEAVEALLQHWGERCRGGLGSPGAAGSSPLAVAMQYGGMIPTSGRGSMGLAGAVDHAAEEVDAAIGTLKQAGLAQDRKLAKAWKLAGRTGRPPFCLETQLVKLAMVRYLPDPIPTVRQQMRRVKIGSERTYHDRVQQLHERVRAELECRRRMQRVHGGRYVA
ncbi:hypothetical protein [Stutzerimonas stutzeri]|uniref:hypothetical protein n=1 Tax=Stutzerimonas stutzeri TaxID=316 RepID=UPI00244CEEA3|nr:hypothetical protein [Stutzerimonas stutzeri]MDH0154344.1 hypothetical protein [Stutzerimonas stutzeri]